MWLARSKRWTIGLVLMGLLVWARPAGATFTQQFTLSSDVTFQGQVSVAMEQWAIFVLTSQASTSPSVAGHVIEANFAIQVLQNPTKWTATAALLIASQGSNPMTPLTVPSTVSDALITTAAGVVLPAMAGYFAVPAQ
jgi:hypothetical protein